MLEVYNGAPAERRDKVENRVYECLARLDIPFTRVDHEAAFTMEDCVAIGEALDVSICKNLLLTPRNRSAFYLLCMPGDKPFSTKDFSKLIGAPGHAGHRPHGGRGRMVRLPSLREYLLPAAENL